MGPAAASRRLCRPRPARARATMPPSTGPQSSVPSPRGRSGGREGGEGGEREGEGQCIFAAMWLLGRRHGHADSVTTSASTP